MAEVAGGRWGATPQLYRALRSRCRSFAQFVLATVGTYGNCNSSALQALRSRCRSLATVGTFVCIWAMMMVSNSLAHFTASIPLQAVATGGTCSNCNSRSLQGASFPLQIFGNRWRLWLWAVRSFSICLCSAGCFDPIVGLGNR